MDLKISIGSETGDIKDSIEHTDKRMIDVRIKDKKTDQEFSSIQGIAFEFDVDDIIMDASMIVLLEGVEFDVKGKTNGVPTRVTFEDDPNRVEIVYVRVECPRPPPVEIKPTKKGEYADYSRSYWFPTAVDVKLYDAETGERLVNIRRWAFGTAVDDIMVLAEAVATGKSLMRKPGPKPVYGIGSRDPISWKES